MVRSLDVATLRGQAPACRRTRPRVAVPALLVSVLWAASAFAAPQQEAALAAGPDRPAPRQGCQGLQRGTSEWSIIAGGADAVSIAHSRTGRQFVTQSLGWGRVLTRPKGPAFFCGQLEALVEIVPVFVMFQSRRSYGYGVTPVFLRWNFGRRRHVEPFVEIAGGILRTDQPVPEDTKRFNFTAHTGLGFRVRVGERRALLFGYRFHHISNAGRGAVNPSVNSNFFYGGLSFLHSD